MAVAWYWKSVFPLFVITFISLCAIKKGFSLISPFIVKNDILPIEKYATIISLQSIASGVGKFLGSHILEKVKLRTMVISMSFLICMLLFLLYQSFYFEQNNFICILVLWNTICFCNSVIWNYGSLLTRHILPPEAQGTFWSFICSSGPFGALLDNYLISQVSNDQPKLFLILGTAYIASLPYLYSIFPIQTSINEYEQQQAKNSTEKSQDHKEEAQTPSGTEKSFSDLSAPLKIKFFFIAISCIVFFIGHKTLLNWGSLSISSISGFDESYMLKICSCWEIGGLIGTSIMGPLSDRFPSYMRLYFCLFAACASCLLLSLLSVSMPIQLYYCINFLLGMFIYIPESYIELIALESMPLSLTSVITSYCGILFQIGTFISTKPVQSFINQFGFDHVHILILCTYAVASLTLFLSTFFSNKTKNVEHEKEE